VRGRVRGKRVALGVAGCVRTDAVTQDPVAKGLGSRDPDQLGGALADDAGDLVALAGRAASDGVVVAGYEDADVVFPITLFPEPPASIRTPMLLTRKWLRWDGRLLPPMTLLSPVITTAAPQAAIVSPSMRLELPDIVKHV
jgi:hypothetical protein